MGPGTGRYWGKRGVSAVSGPAVVPVHVPVAVIAKPARVNVAVHEMLIGELLVVVPQQLMFAFHVPEPRVSPPELAPATDSAHEPGSALNSPVRVPFIDHDCGVAVSVRPGEIVPDPLKANAPWGGGDAGSLTMSMTERARKVRSAWSKGHADGDPFERVLASCADIPNL
jgi:hypothetical protein